MKRNSLVLGATQGIGLALVAKLLELETTSVVYATYRSKSDTAELNKLKSKYSNRIELIKIDLDSEESFESLADLIQLKSNSLDLVINSLGVLQGDFAEPERKVEELKLEGMVESFGVNAFPSFLVAKYLKELMRSSEFPRFIGITAKVGSVEDNKLGGWYSYRASKAAHNMFLKNFSIEMKRLNKSSVVAAVHPGTTATNLSKDFIEMAAKKYTIHTPGQAAENLLNLIDRLEGPEDSGKFFSWDGSEIPW